MVASGKITGKQRDARLAEAAKVYAPDFTALKAPAPVLNEPIRAQRGDGVVEHKNPNTSFLGHKIKYRHDVDKVLANLRKWDVDNAKTSLKMQWLQKEAFPRKSPEEIYALSKENLYSAVTREARDVNPRGAVKLGSDISYRLRTGEGGRKAPEVVQEMRTRVEDALRRFGFRGKVVVDNRENFPASAQRAHAEAEGFAMPDGTIYIDAAKNKSHADAVFTAFHEAFHRGELGSEAEPYAKALERAGRNKTVRAIADEVKKTYESYGKTIDDSLAIREALADIHGAQKTGNWGELKDRTAGGVDVSPLARANAFGAVRRVLESLKAVFAKLFNRPMTNHEINDLVDSTFKKSSNNVQSTSNQIAHEVQLLKTNAKLDRLKVEPELTPELTSVRRQQTANEATLAAIKKVAQKAFDAQKITPEQYQRRISEAEAKYGAKPQDNSIQGIANRALDLAKDTSRAFKLSGLLIAPKLLGAVGWKLALSPAEQAVISAMRIIPAIDRIAQGARRYSGFNSEAELKALKKTFSAKTLQQMYQAATKGNIDIDKFRELAHVSVEDVGNEAKLDRPVRDFVTRLHAALKTPLKINEFSRSSTLRTQAEVAQNIANGMKPAEAVKAANSEEAQSRIGIESYIDAQRAVMLGDNKLHDAIEGILKAGKESDSFIGKTVGHSADLLLPVRKVPLNIGAEALEYGAGGFNAASKLLKIGADKLTSQERDYVLRNLSKQTIGLALGYLAVKGLIAGGGYFTDDKRDFEKGKPHPLDMSFFGKNAFQTLLHSPALDIVQAIANYKKLVGRGQSASEATARTAEGFASEHAPLFDLADRFVKAMAEHPSKNSNYQSKADKLMDNIIKGFVIPGAVSSSAVLLDNARNRDVTERKSHDLKTVLQKGVPLAREELPAYKD